MQSGVNPNEENRDWVKFLNEEENANVISQFKNELANEILNLRRDKKVLENRVKSLEIESINMSQKMYPSYLSKESMRGDIGSQLNQILQYKTRFLPDDSKSLTHYFDQAQSIGAIDSNADSSLFSTLKSPIVKMPPIDNSRSKNKNDVPQNFQEQINPKFEAISKAANPKPNSTLVQIKSNYPYIATNFRQQTPTSTTTPLRNRSSRQSDHSQGSITNNRRANSRGSNVGSRNNISFT